MKKLLFDFLPLILFFLAFKYFDVFVATEVAIAASVVQFGWLVASKHEIEGMHWVNVAVIVVFGGLTLFFHNDTFIKWKPTVLYWIFGGSLLAGRVMGRNLIRSVLGKQLELPDKVWDRLNYAWMVFFFVAGILNLYVAFTFPLETWVNFKVFGLMGLIFVFVIAQTFYLARHLPQEEG